jgi:hypothetical protein
LYTYKNIKAMVLDKLRGREERKDGRKGGSDEKKFEGREEGKEVGRTGRKSKVK